MADYYLVEFTGRIGVKVYSAKDKAEAIQKAELAVIMADGENNILLDAEEVESVEEMDDE